MKKFLTTRTAPLLLTAAALALGPVGCQTAVTREVYVVPVEVKKKAEPEPKKTYKPSAPKPRSPDMFEPMRDTPSTIIDPLYGKP